MHLVSTVVVSSNNLNAEETAYIRSFQHAGGDLDLRHVSRRDFGGERKPESPVLVGAFERFDATEFVNHLKYYDWSRSGLSVTIWSNGLFLKTWHQKANGDAPEPKPVL